MGFKEMRQKAIEEKEQKGAAKEAAQEVANERDANPEVVWEYKARNLAKVFGPMVEGDFNSLGAKGWEFQAMGTGGSEGYAIFKRRGRLA